MMRSELAGAFGWKASGGFPPRCRSILIRDSLLSDGQFLLHHFLQSYLSESSHSATVLSFSHDFYHYDSVHSKTVWSPFNFIQPFLQNLDLRKCVHEGRLTFFNGNSAFRPRGQVSSPFFDASRYVESVLTPFKSKSSTSRRKRRKRPRRRGTNRIAIAMPEPAAVAPSVSVSESPASLFRLFGSLDDLVDLIPVGEGEGEEEGVSPSDRIIIIDDLDSLFEVVCLWMTSSDGDADAEEVPLPSQAFFDLYRRLLNAYSFVIGLTSSSPSLLPPQQAQLFHISDCVLTVRPLATGYSRDVCGEVECLNKHSLSKCPYFESFVVKYREGDAGVRCRKVERKKEVTEFQEDTLHDD